MYLSKLLLKDFGKFHNKNVDLAPGINVVVGDKGAGKSTVRDFLTGMMYGIPRREGISKIRSQYDLRKPKNTSSYAGTAYMKKDGESYLVERTFLAGGKKTSVMNVQTGREVRLNNPDTLMGTVIETDKNTFIDTKCLTCEKGSDDATELENFLTNISTTGTSYINETRAVQYLQKEKKKNNPKPLVRRLDQLDAKMSQYDDVEPGLQQVSEELKKLNEDFIIEAEKRKRVARRLVENEDGSVTYQENKKFDEQMDRITENERKTRKKDEEETEKPKKPLQDRMPIILLTGLFVIAVMAVIVNIIPFHSTVRKLFMVLTCMGVVYTIVDGLIYKGVFDSEDESGAPTEEDFTKVLDEIREESEQQEEMEFDMTFAKEYAVNKEALKKKEAALLDRKHEKAVLKAEFDQVFKKKSEMEDEIKAIDFAIAKIQSLSERYMEDAYENILGHISEMIPRMTGGKYDSINIDPEEGFVVSSHDGDYALDSLASEDVEMIFLAVRLAISKYMTKEQLPLIIDGTDILTSLEQKKAFAHALVDMNEEQIVILTEDRDFTSVFANMGIIANAIEL